MAAHLRERIVPLLDTKKVGRLPVEISDETKRTNEIGTVVVPMLDALELGLTATTDALLTQRTLAHFHRRGARFAFSVKANPPTVQGGSVL